MQPPKLSVWDGGRSGDEGSLPSCVGDRDLELGVTYAGTQARTDPGNSLMYAYEVSVVSLITLPV